MKTVTIHIEPEEGQTEYDYTLECSTAINGKYYHDCLQGVLSVLMKYGEDTKLAPSGKKVLEDIRQKTARYLTGVRNGE